MINFSIRQLEIFVTVVERMASRSTCHFPAGTSQRSVPPSKCAVMSVTAAGSTGSDACTAGCCSQR